MSNVETDVTAARSVGADPSGQNRDAINAWIVQYIARLLECPANAVDCNKTFDQLGLDSMMLVVMSEDLGRWLRRDIDPTAAYDHPTIDRFTARVVEMPSDGPA
jgi:acyl carrier protein